ncbi:MAG: haloalkane dehalogenase [Rhodospirillales bacterium]|nr:haloalkane dehalogenase [Rhodospirillales bacterium]
MGARMHYVEEGIGDPILFIHGNPTSSYLWRNIIPHVSSQGRAIAVDLIGMGKSDKPDIDYRLVDHIRYLEGFIEALGLKNLTLAIHDWGSVLGMHYARRHAGNVKAIAFMEAIVPPAAPLPDYAALGPGAGKFFHDVRTPGLGEKMILEQNMFVEALMPQAGIVRELTAPEREVYRAPFSSPMSRKPTLVWPREVPIAGEPADTTAIVIANGEWLHATDIPKLFLYAAPGAFGSPKLAAYFAANLKNIETAYVGMGVHFIQEDQPEAIGRALADWRRRLPRGR